MTAPLVLGFDTSGGYCAACLWQDGRALHSAAEDMTRGQAERLMPLLEDLLTAEGYTWSALDALAVGIGPGNFTGIRIAVSAARGLALGLNIPAYGVTGFQARALLAPDAKVITVPAPRNQVYVWRDGAPHQIDAAALDTQGPPPSPAALAAAIAQTAAARWPAIEERPAPLYARPADAAPPRDAPPVLLD